MLIFNILDLFHNFYIQVYKFKTYCLQKLLMLFYQVH